MTDLVQKMENSMDNDRPCVENGYGNRTFNPDLEKRQRRKRLAVTCILIVLFTCGLLINESDYMGRSHTTAIQYLEVYSAFLPLLIYIVPFLIFMKHIVIKYEMSGMELLTAAFCGAFIPAALAGEVNGGFDDLMKSLMGHAYSDAWLGSLEAGIAEELLKLVTTAMLLYVWKRKTLKEYLAIGMCVGMGFQIEEDISYITESGFKNVNDAFPTALDRISGALGSHWAYAAVTAAGLYLIVRACEKNHKRKGIGWIVFVMADHFLYDTPIGDVTLFNVILTVAVVLPVVIFFKNPEITKIGQDTDIDKPGYYNQNKKADEIT
ncbi:MAG: PrsW family glutamic-type intramembrane protease [Lachnospiraceae bacterium]|nr:PrsW family glutamic-type intramembrane protease [Lachnospiraceae bacterium]